MKGALVMMNSMSPVLNDDLTKFSLVFLTSAKHMKPISGAFSAPVHFRYIPRPAMVIDAAVKV